MKFSQFGTFSVVSLFSIIGLFVFLFLKSGFSFLIGGLLLLFIVCLLYFYKLCIYIDDNCISFKLGIGLFVRKYKISDIKSCQSVKNPISYGIGVRILPNGMLYNVSGLSAIELKFKNKKDIVRIGTNKPDLIVDYLTKKLDNSPAEYPKPWEKLNSGFAYGWLLFVFIFILIGADLFYSKQEPEITIHNKRIEISGIYGLNIPIDNIAQIDLEMHIPSFEKTDGFGFGLTYKGNFELSEIGPAILFIEFGSPPYIKLRTLDNKFIFLNFKNKQKTKVLFDKIIAVKNISRY